MKFLTVDFGSTYTKLTAIDSDLGCVLGTASAFTTIETDVMDGFNHAFAELQSCIGEYKYDQLLCCSSAAGGLKMVALGLVPDLTAKAARMAASSAGAKVIKTYSFEISQDEADEIYAINPDLVLLCGGTDGGNKEVIVANAKRLAAIDRPFAIIVAGNKTASDDIRVILSQSDKRFEITDNVMPQFNRLNIEPARQCIKELFISRIVEAKGLKAVQEMTSHKIIPTPLAVMTGCELLSKGTRTEPGIGDLLAIDIGGATTDVYSMSDGHPSMENVMTKGIPEPYAKRSVEGDLGMRYSLKFLAAETDLYAVAAELDTSVENISDWVDKCLLAPDTLAHANSIEQRIEESLAQSAVRVAVERHCGILELAYTPVGEVFTLNGKDLSNVPCVIGIGGVLINASDPAFILAGAKANPVDYTFAKPKSPKYMLDKKYIFASMGLLSAVDKDLALKIMKQEVIGISN